LSSDNFSAGGMHRTVRQTRCVETAARWMEMKGEMSNGPGDLPEQTMLLGKKGGMRPRPRPIQ